LTFLSASIFAWLYLSLPLSATPEKPANPNEIAKIILEGPFLDRIRSDDTRSLKHLEDNLRLLSSCDTESLEDGLILAVEESEPHGVHLAYVETNIAALNKLAFLVPDSMTYPWRKSKEGFELGPVQHFTSGPLTKAVTEFRRLEKSYTRRKAIAPAPEGGFR